jgi:hypothetical protein
MTTTIQEELAQVLADWQSGKELRVLELGHTQQMEDFGSDGSQRLSLSKPLLENDQERVYGYVFEALARCLEDNPLDYEMFLAFCGDLAAKDLTPEERAGAQSLAWKALKVGWARALEGHPETRFIKIKKAKKSK